jgi:hypothetical protein
MHVKRHPPVTTEPLAAEAVQPSPEPAENAGSDFQDSVGGLFAGPVSLLPDVPPEAGEPPVRSLFAPRGLFRS